MKTLKKATSTHSIIRGIVEFHKDSCCGARS